MGKTKMQQQQKKEKKGIVLGVEWEMLMRMCDELGHIMDKHEKEMDEYSEKYDDHSVLHQYYKGKLGIKYYTHFCDSEDDCAKFRSRMEKHENKMNEYKQLLEEKERLYELTRKKFDETCEKADKIRRKCFYGETKKV